MNKYLLILSVGLAGASQQVSATVLQLGDHLSIDSGSGWLFSDGGVPIFSSLPLLGEEGIIVGPTLGDTGTGSHSGFPTSSDVGAVTQVWDFLANTGYNYFSTTLGSGSFSGDTTNGVDMSSWVITWNSVDPIPLGGCSVVTGGCDVDSDGIDDIFDTGLGTFGWSGIYGDTYSITYTATVPVGDPSSLGGLQYELVLAGVVTSPVPIPPAVWLFGSGLLGLVGVSRRKKQHKYGNVTN